ncbi:tetratricopeptide repeat-containing glycosyltransferase family 2 protein [Priestia megaterium]|uniref:tetratricopeptide repeat-containing glycosyltransferase family 2 protein n=1 Tax=Priestia megaterium TaxID=1404 RepID=UPI00203CA800|nr:glycosyltransferase family 2 protein [Priestia megaterium]MCM3194106.1 glycosyltransferase family 2 protein [Priestia megaterium]
MIPVLSVCMIVKNEEKVLNRCLDSIIGIADEIIIVDTGSSDNTKKTSFDYTDKVFDYQWNDDFSKARNFAASKARGEWILVMDADEFVDRESFITFRNQLQDRLVKENIFFVQIVNFLGEDGRSTSLNYHERLYRNDGKISYYRSIHELLKHENGVEIRGKADLQIFHSGYMSSTVNEKNKSERNLQLLKSIKEKEGIDYYFLGNEYYSLREFDKAISNYKKGYQIKENVYFEWVQKLLIRLIHCLHYTKKDQEAMDIINSCEDLFSNTVDFKFLKGKIYANEWKSGEAIKIFEFILNNKENLHAELSLDYLEQLPHRFLGELYEREGKFDLTVFHYSRFLALNENDDEIWTKLITLLANHSSKADLVQFIQKNIFSRTTMTAPRFLKILLASHNIEVQRLVIEFDFENQLTAVEQEAAKVKYMFLQKEYNLVADTIDRNMFEYLNALLLTNIFSIIDLLLLTLKLNHQKYKTYIKQLNLNPKVTSLLNLLFLNKRVKLSESEVTVFIELYKQTVALQDEELENLFLYKKSLMLNDQRMLKREINQLIKDKV